MAVTVGDGISVSATTLESLSGCDERESHRESGRTGTRTRMRHSAIVREALKQFKVRSP
jgi:hypothetical protein